MTRPNVSSMPAIADPRDAEIYERLRSGLLRAHCADKRPAHLCAGSITIDARALVLNCARCGDAKLLLLRPNPRGGPAVL